MALNFFGYQWPVRLAYQPPASSTFLSEQSSHQQPASSTFLSEQISTSHQPPATSHQPNERAAALPGSYLAPSQSPRQD
jgi:hypothetical protein